jgi:hypothetical protein
MENDKNKQSTSLDESNAERDQDEGQMNNGTIGGDMGVVGSTNEDQTESSSKEAKTGNENVGKNLADR